MARQSQLMPYVNGLVETTGFTKVGFRPEQMADVVLLPRELKNRLHLRGANLVDTGHEYVKAAPRLARGDYGDMVYLSGGLHSAEIAVILRRFCKPGSWQWAEFMNLRTAKRTEMADGNGEYNVVKNVEPVKPPPSEEVWSKKNTNAKVKKYTLAQLFCDSFLQTKYDVPVKFRRDMQLVAMTNPDDAAATYQDYLQSKSPTVKVLVSAAGYKRSAHRAAGAIANLAAGLPRASAAVGAEVIGAQLFMMSEDVELPWHVQGPLSHAASVAHVFSLASYGGLRETMFLLGDETQVLGIDIFERDLCISPTVVGHARSREDEELPLESHEESLLYMTEYAKERMSRVSVNVRPIYGNGGIVASAVRFDPRMVMVNNHVIQYDTTATVDGVKLDGSVPVSSDLWMQRSEGRYEHWQVGEAKPGDKVAILYHNGLEPVLSAPFDVLRVDGVMVTSSRNHDVVVGMSGGALVSLTDFSLLGVHTGMMTRILLASAISERVKLDLVEMLEQENLRRVASTTSADDIMMQLKSRGLHKGLVQTLQRMVPLLGDDGRHVGTAVKVSGKLLTTCPMKSYGSTEGELGFGGSDGFYSVCVHPGAASVGKLPQVRVPQVHEKVCVVVATEDGPYLSAQTTIRQVGTGARSFFLDVTRGNLFSLVGGIVVSVSDGAVLGSFCRDTTVPSMSIMSLCASFPAVQEKEVDPVEELGRVFPMLHVSMWDQTLLASAIRHVSLVWEGEPNSAMALRGDAQLRSMLYERLAESGVPYSEWNVYSQSLLSNRRMASLIHDLGLEKILRSQAGLVLPPGHKAYADMLEAICCVVSMEEESLVVKMFMEVLGFVPSSDDLMSGDPHEHMMRRPSELGLASAEGAEVSQLLTPVD